ncbi:PLP-dependent aminotransferase family protein [Pseudomonas sp. GD03860]|uniref:aminotransferase-like domain-containing protein n=1 Tax=Pseudomonas TaxID=286 RepID=UPI0023632DF4|nr:MULTISPECIES: PLP-dependent aminotransferase family protein [Pseudomonas]MDD2058065.1 PLP-dependent aminotransferase family protein [Pseudomonas putida]MDH0639522.1 PLP-dependent aminotransferase family protein [Pseudomonas sp. GD03860]
MKHENNSRFAYQAVYRYLLELIAQMAPGSYCRLPSLRDLAQRLNVSISTVQYAYSLLEHEGRVQSVPKSGYFACGPESGMRTGTGGDLLHDLQHHANRPRMLVLSSGRGQTLPSLEATLLGTERQLLRQYPRPVASVHPCGELELRTALAARYTRSAQLYWSAEDVYLAGDLRALVDMLVAALELHGCRVLVTTPCSWRLLRILKSAGLQVLELPLGERGEVDLEQLAAVLGTGAVRMVMMASHLNCPQGSVVSDEQRQGIAELLVRHGVWLLENDLDFEWSFDRPAQCLRELVDPQRLLVISSLERTVGAEAPYAYLLSRNCQAPLQREFLARDFQLPPLRQQAVARLYAKGRIDVHLEQLRLYLRESVAHLHRQMQVQLGNQLHFQMPAGGATVWAQARAPLDTRALFHRLLDQGLVIAPGELFSLQGHFRQHMRLGWPSRQQGDLQEGLSVLHQELQRAQKARR